MYNIDKIRSGIKLLSKKIMFHKFQFGVLCQQCYKNVNIGFKKSKIYWNTFLTEQCFHENSLIYSCVFDIFFARLLKERKKIT